MGGLLFFFLWSIDATANTVFVRRGRAFPRKQRRPLDKQASGPHTNTLGREIKSLIKLTDLIELMAYT